MRGGGGGGGGESKEREGRERRGEILILYKKYFGATGQLSPRMH